MKRKMKRGSVGITCQEPSPMTPQGAHSYECETGTRLASAMGIYLKKMLRKDDYSLELQDTYQNPGDSKRAKRNPYLRELAFKLWWCRPRNRVEIMTADQAREIERHTGFPIPRDGKFREIPHPFSAEGKFYASQIPHPSPRNKNWEASLALTSKTFAKAFRIAAHPFKRRR